MFRRKKTKAKEVAKAVANIEPALPVRRGPNANRSLPTPKIEMYKDIDGWCWDMTATNGKIIAKSTKAYVRKRDCRQSIERFVQMAPTARILTYKHDL